MNFPTARDPETQPMSLGEQWDAAHAASDHSKRCLDRVAYRAYVNEMINNYPSVGAIEFANELLRIDPEVFECTCDEESGD